MVIVNNFDFELVSAEDKVPFKEHQKNGKTFVEVEPDAEYFLKIRKVKEDGKDHLCDFTVDGQNLGYDMQMLKSDTSVWFQGIFNRSNSVTTTRALKFVKAPMTNRVDKDATLAGMGKIEMKVYDAVLVGLRRRFDFDSPFVTSSILRVNEAPVTMKKNLRSGVGSHSESSRSSIRSGKTHRSKSSRPSDSYNHYGRGNHLFTVTLYYCAAPALISVGVLQKPSLWEHHRMVCPKSQSAEGEEDYVVSVSTNRRGQQIFVLE